MIKLTPNKSEIDAYKEKQDKIFFDSRFQFLNAHYGIRPKSLHGILGTTASGKSTLSRTILSEISKTNRCLVWLSEEERTPYVSKLNLDQKQMDNITWTEEVSLPMDLKEDQKELFKHFERTIIDSGCEIVFIDNITTSCFYSDSIRPSGQARSADFLSKCSRDFCTVVYAAHTKSEFIDNSNRLMTSEDIRGSKSIVNVTEYLYLFQKFIVDTTHYNFIQITKARGMKSSLAGNFYLLKFDNGLYISDSLVDFDAVQDIFKQRNTLGRKNDKGREPKRSNSIDDRKQNSWFPE